MDLGLKGKSAFVAASSRGLGYATALALAREGCRVAVNGRSKQVTEAAAGTIAAETGMQVLPLAAETHADRVPLAKTKRRSVGHNSLSRGHPILACAPRDCDVAILIEVEVSVARPSDVLVAGGEEGGPVLEVACPNST